MDAYNVAWCARLFESLADEGVWAVPRSGLVFHKRGRSLVLVARMPHESAMPITESELLEQQEEELTGIRDHFGAAGIEVRLEQ